MSSTTFPRTAAARLRSVPLLLLFACLFAAGFAALARAQTQGGAIPHLMDRLHDAQRLTRNAGTLSTSSSILKFDAAQLISAYSEEAPGQPSRYDQVKRYSEILSAYQQALHDYLQHRKEVQQHAAQFHQQAQDEKVLDSPIDIPAWKALRVQAQDACLQLQMQERQLAMGELQLRDAVETLIAQRQRLLPGDYLARWQMTAKLAILDHNAAQNFEDSVAAKQTSTSSTLDNQVHLAFISGDYVESQHTFSDVEQRSSIMRQEMQRAALHTNIANQFLMRLSLLDPNQPASAQPGANSFTTDPDAVSDADAQLSSEYQHVQDLYAELQKARPKN